MDPFWTTLDPIWNNFPNLAGLTSAFVRTFFTLPGRLRVKPLGVAVPELERELPISLLVGAVRSNFLKRSPEVADNFRTSGR